MSEELAIQNQESYEAALATLPIPAFTDQTKFEDLVGGDWFKRLQLFSTSSNPVKEGKFPMNHWGIVVSKDQIIDLGEECNVLPISWRFAATQLGEPIINSYDPKSPTYQMIMKNSGVQNSGAFYGFEFLCWIPSHKMFASYFANSPTARNEAPKLLDILKQRKPATFKSQTVKNTKNTWRGPVHVPCSVMLEYPHVDQLKEVAAKFATPKESLVEIAAPNTDPNARVR